MKASEVIANLQRRFPNEPEYIQAVSQVLGTIEEEYNKHPEFEKANLIERLCIPDRIIQFRVSWVDDKGNVQTNMGYRVQHNNAIGPYKGGLRYHKSVNLGILKFLAFEQTFKNSLTTLPMGGANADFPKFENYGITRMDLDDYLFDKQAILDMGGSKRTQLTVGGFITVIPVLILSCFPDKSPIYENGKALTTVIALIIGLLLACFFKALLQMIIAYRVNKHKETQMETFIKAVLFYEPKA
jgi:hypothetical protein